jgi:hypothetical protein
MCGLFFIALSNTGNATAPAQVIPIQEMKTKSTGTYYTEGFAITKAPKCKCPPGDMCKCAPSGILISQKNKPTNELAPWAATNKEEMFLATDPVQFDIGKKYLFLIKIDRTLTGWQANSLLDFKLITK